MRECPEESNKNTGLKNVIAVFPSLKVSITGQWFSTSSARKDKKKSAKIKGFKLDIRKTS